MKPIFKILVFVLSSALFSSNTFAEVRQWRNADGTKSLEADFLSRDESTVTLRRTDGRVLSFAISKLHLEEQSYLKETHPHSPLEDEKEPVGDAFGPLRFGDNRTQVEEKLLSSNAVKANVDQTLFGRTGLNGVFETSQTVGGLSCFLYFGWNELGNLQEVTLRTKPLSADFYPGKLNATWKELTALLNKLYGNPVSESPYPNQNELQDGLILSSHLWRTSDGYSVLLGTGQERSDYIVTVRFTTKRIQPVVTP